MPSAATRSTRREANARSDAAFGTAQLILCVFHFLLELVELLLIGLGGDVAHAAADLPDHQDVALGGMVARLLQRLLRGLEPFLRRIQACDGLLLGAAPLALAA